MFQLFATARYERSRALTMDSGETRMRGLFDATSIQEANSAPTNQY